MKLKLDYDYSFDFKLLAIVSSLRNYRLCHFINKTLHTLLSKAEYLEIHSSKKRQHLLFDLYLYKDEVSQLEYKLLSNKYNGDYLIPEMKEVDFFFIIEGDLAEKSVSDALTSLKLLNVIQAIFEVDPNQLKSKQNLITE